MNEPSSTFENWANFNSILHLSTLKSKFFLTSLQTGEGIMIQNTYNLLTTFANFRIHIIIVLFGYYTLYKINEIPYERNMFTVNKSC